METYGPANAVIACDIAETTAKTNALFIAVSVGYKTADYGSYSCLWSSVFGNSSSTGSKNEHQILHSEAKGYQALSPAILYLRAKMGKGLFRMAGKPANPARLRGLSRGV